MSKTDSKLIKYADLNWLKNASENGGAQQSVIDSCPENHVCIKSWTKDKGQIWADTSPEKLYSLVHRNIGLQETLAKFPYKVYFDIDEPTRDESLLERSLSLVNEFFPNGDIAVSGSISDEKTSYHISLSNYLIKNHDERKYLKDIVKIMKETIQSFDVAVYS